MSEKSAKTNKDKSNAIEAAASETTAEGPRKDRKGKIRMSFIDITMIKNAENKD